jgi:hypothetical protein
MKPSKQFTKKFMLERKMMSMNTEPVAIRYDFDGYGYQYMDSGSGSDWLTRVDGELLYAQPNEHDLGIAEAIGFDRGYKVATAKTLTDEELLEYVENFSQQKGSLYVFQEENVLEMIRSILESK